MHQMSDQLDALLADGDNDSDLVKSLRKALRESNKSLRDVQESLDKQAKATRSTTLSVLLKEANLPEKAAKFFPADQDVTKENVAKWLEEDGDLFGYQPQSGSSTASEEEQAAAQRMTSVTGQAPPAHQAFDPMTLVAEIQNAKTPAELDAIYAKAGMKPH